MNVDKQAFGQTTDGTPVDLYTLSNDNGMTCTITNYGGIIVSLLVPDRDGNLEVYVMNSDGSNQTRLTDNPALDGVPAWAP